MRFGASAQVCFYPSTSACGVAFEESGEVALYLLASYVFCLINVVPLHGFFDCAATTIVEAELYGLNPQC